MKAFFFIRLSALSRMCSRESSIVCFLSVFKQFFFYFNGRGENLSRTVKVLCCLSGAICVRAKRPAPAVQPAPWSVFHMLLKIRLLQRLQLCLPQRSRSVARHPPRRCKVRLPPLLPTAKAPHAPLLLLSPKNQRFFGDPDVRRLAPLFRSLQRPVSYTHLTLPTICSV